MRTWLLVLCLLCGVITLMAGCTKNPEQSADRIIQAESTITITPAPVAPAPTVIAESIPTYPMPDTKLFGLKWPEIQKAMGVPDETGSMTYGDGISGLKWTYHRPVTNYQTVLIFRSVILPRDKYSIRDTVNDKFHASLIGFDGSVAFSGRFARPDLLANQVVPKSIANRTPWEIYWHNSDGWDHLVLYWLTDFGTAVVDIVPLDINNKPYAEVKSLDENGQMVVKYVLSETGRDWFNQNLFRCSYYDKKLPSKYVCNRSGPVNPWWHKIK